MSAVLHPSPARQIPAPTEPMPPRTAPPAGPAVPGEEHVAEAFQRDFLTLMAMPQRADAAIRLGLLCARLRWNDYAEIFFRRAVDIAGADLQPVALYHLGRCYQRSARLSEALDCFQRAVHAAPRLQPARRPLVEVALALGHGQLAEQHLAALSPHAGCSEADIAAFHGRLAVHRSHHGEARTWFQRAVQCNPASPEFWRQYLRVVDAPEPARQTLDLATAIIAASTTPPHAIVAAVVDAFCQERQWEQLELCLNRLPSPPDQRRALYQTAVLALYEAKQFKHAVDLCTQALAGGWASAKLIEVAAICQAQRRHYDAARRLFRIALHTAPGDVSIRSNAIHLLMLERDTEGAISLARQTASQHPHEARAHLAHGRALTEGFRLSEAEAALRKGLALPGLRPHELVELQLGLARTLLAQGRTGHATSALESAVAAAPANLAACEALATAQRYNETASLDGLARERRRLASQCLDRVLGQRPGLDGQSRLPNRTLRIGFVLPDLYRHPVGALLASWLGHVDQTRFEICAYTITPGADRELEHLCRQALLWRDCIHMSTDGLARQIQADGIDILMNLDGTASAPALAVLALKPAPIQLSWAGHALAATLATVDGIVLDRFTAPRNTGLDHPVPPLHLGCAPYCYVPQTPHPVATTPALVNGHVTFGCFADSLSSLSETTLSMWAKAMAAVPRSRLLLRNGALADANTLDAIQRRIEKAGIERDRVRYEAATGTAADILAYDRVDIALDTAPVNGCLVTLQGLWQGVPLLTRSGARSESRIGGAIMHSLSLSSWVAETDQQFVAAAVAKTLDIEHLNRTRQTLRDRLRSAPTGDGRLFARRMENLWRDSWYRLCRAQCDPSPRPSA